MFKFIAQLLISATVGLAFAAGSNPDVRGYVEQAWHESNAYIQQTADLAADTVSNITVQAVADGDTSANVDANIFAEDASVESTSDVQVDSGLSIDAALPELLDVQANGTAETQAQTDASVELDDVSLNLIQMLGLKLGFGLGR